jgi:hypothetical protein
MKKLHLFAAVSIIGIVGILALLGPGLGVILVVLTGLFSAVIGIGYVQTYYRVWQTDPADLRAVSGADGPIEVAGSVEPHEDTLTAPYTGSECVLYSIKMTELGMSESEKRRFRERQELDDADIYLHAENYSTTVVATNEQSQPFVVATDTGKALIEPGGSQWQITTEEDIHVQTGEEPPERIAQWIETQSEIDLIGDDERVFREQRLNVGDEAHIYGPIRETGSSFDLPGGVNVVIGLENPDDRFVVGEDSLSELIDQIKSENRSRFVISTGGEIEAERRLLKTGAFWGGIGVVFVGIGIFLTV